ncbi:MAG: branched-chain amino acid transaminase [Candidatus Obscuribacterales bacterium]|jgi:branched-chain amino acid aminotransferase|nr:branched-chain amino acid transaminase [Candidatus Obscuribacterales bacterium]
MDKKQQAFFEGKFVPLEDAKISIMTTGFLYGTAIFEGMRGYWNENKKEMYVFRMREHYERMMDSMKIMHMDLKYSVDELCQLTVELLRRNAPQQDTYIRPTVYKSACKIGPSLENNPTELCMFTIPFGDYFHGSDGLSVQVSNWRRVEDNAIPARAKIVGAYANTALAKTDALTAGFDDCIVLSENGHVSEGSAMNIFMVKRGKLITTLGTENILEGITRNTVFEMAENELGIKTECRQIDRSELYMADELFFCGTGAQIGPITSVDKRLIADGKVGPISDKIRTLYTAICRGEHNKYHKWLTPVYHDKGNQFQNCNQVINASPNR